MNEAKKCTTGEMQKPKIKQRGLSLFAKLTIVLLIMSLIPIVVVGALSIYSISVFSLRERAQLGIANANVAISTFDNRINNLRLKSIEASLDEDLVEILTWSYDHPDSQLDMKDLYYVRQLLMKNFDQSMFHSIYLFMANGQTVTSQPAELLKNEEMKQLSWYKDNMQTENNYFWGEPMRLNRNLVLPYVRRVTDEENKSTLGYILTNIYESTIYDFYSSNERLSLLNHDDTILSGMDKELIGQDYFTAQGLKSVPLAQSSGHLVLPQNGESKLLMYSTDSVNGFKIIELLDYDPARFMVRDMVNNTAVIVIICAVVCVILAIYFSRGFVRPLRSIRAHVDTLEMNKLKTDMRSRSNDEIGLLIDSFNNMSQRLDASRKEIIRISEAQRKAEYRAIELQINPHFLYNTLSSITWLANEGEKEKIKMVASYLSTLFRISVNKGQELVQIREEIEHVRCYLDILKIRHENEFHYQLDLDPAIMNYYSIKILLQPLVENSIQHGIRKHEIKDGFVCIRAYEKAERIILEVLDNGNTSQEEIESMNKMLVTSEDSGPTGIGMLNVHGRIRHYYNEDFGLRYEKRDGMTVAHIELPIIRERKDV